MGGFPTNVSASNSGMVAGYVTNRTSLPEQGFATGTADEGYLQYETEFQSNPPSSDYPSIEVPAAFRSLDPLFDIFAGEDLLGALFFRAEPSSTISQRAAFFGDSASGHFSGRTGTGSSGASRVAAGDDGIQRSAGEFTGLPATDIGDVVIETMFSGSLNDPDAFVRYAVSVIGERDVASLYRIAEGVGFPPKKYPARFIEALAEIVAEKEIFGRESSSAAGVQRSALASARAWDILWKNSDADLRFWNFLVNGDLSSDLDINAADIRTLTAGTGFKGNDFREFMEFAGKSLGWENLAAFMKFAEDLGIDRDGDQRRLAVAVSRMIKSPSDSAAPIVALLFDRAESQNALERRLNERYLPPINRHRTAADVVSMINNDTFSIQFLSDPEIEISLMKVRDAIRELSTAEQFAVLSKMETNIKSLAEWGSSFDNIANVTARYIRILGSVLGVESYEKGQEGVDFIADEVKFRPSNDERQKAMIGAIGVLKGLYDSAVASIR